MKQLRLILLTAFVLAATACTAAAQTKVATVDMKKVFNGYWKTRQATADLESRKTELRKEIKDMTDGLDKAQTEYKQLIDEAADPVLSADERDKRKLSAAAKIKEITSKKGELEQFQRQADAQLGDQSQRMSSNLIADIQKAVADKAKAGGYSMVVNSVSSEAIIYVNTDNDITATVLSQLNAGAPIDLTKPAGGAGINLSTNQP